VAKSAEDTRFILVRHGETDWNNEKRFQGHADTPLNAHGVLQARRVRSYFDELESIGLELHHHCVSSDLCRAYTTAQIIHGEKRPSLTLNNRLRERHYGQLSGLTSDEMQVQSPREYESLRNRILDAPLQGGESLRDFYHRVVLEFESISVDQRGKTTLMVAHGGVLDCIYRHCTGESLEKKREWLLPNCALNVIDIDCKGNKNVRLWAWLGHLSNDNTRVNIDEVDGRIA
jgi:probable phosphoglycerate mutase